MKFNKNIKNSLLSFLILLAGFGILIYETSINKNELGSLFAFSIYYLYLVFIFLILGLIAVVLLFLKFYKPKISFVFNFIGVTNLMLGFAGLFLYFTAAITEKGVLPYFGLSTLIGFFILYNVYKHFTDQTGQGSSL